jgi:hypothetical protein
MFVLLGLSLSDEHRKFWIRNFPAAFAKKNIFRLYVTMPAVDIVRERNCLNTKASLRIIVVSSPLNHMLEVVGVVDSNGNIQ